MSAINSRMRIKSGVILLLITIPLLAAPQKKPHHESPEQQILAPGYSTLTFEAPKAGSYTLPALGPAADGTLLDSLGNDTSLHDLYDGKFVILSFIFTSCSDVNGCPLATYVLSKVQRGLATDAKLKDKVRLVSISFDPLNDSPEVMASYGAQFKKQNIDWSFLTADSEQSLAPLLQDYDQSIIRGEDEEGQPTGSISHILRVYLIDPDKRIRNIYSPSFLHPDILLADVRTIANEQPSEPN